MQPKPDTPSAFYHVATQQGEQVTILNEQEILDLLSHGRLLPQDLFSQDGKSEWQPLESRFSIPPPLPRQDAATSPHPLPPSPLPDKFPRLKTPRSFIPGLLGILSILALALLMLLLKRPFDSQSRAARSTPAAPVSPFSPPKKETAGSDAGPSNRIVDKRAVEQDNSTATDKDAEAARHYELAATQIALHSPGPPYTPEILHHLRAAAELAHPEATYHLSIHHASLPGADQTAKATNLLDIAATLNHPEAAFQMGLIRQKGTPVFSQDYQMANVLFRLAAGQGHAAAQFHLGENCAQGLGMKAAPAQAMHWWETSAQLGYAPAQQRLASHQRLPAAASPQNPPVDSPQKNAVPIHISAISGLDIGDSLFLWKEAKIEGICTINIPSSMEPAGGLYGAIPPNFFGQPEPRDDSAPVHPITLQQKGLNALNADAQNQYARLMIDVPMKHDPSLPPPGKEITPHHLADLDKAMRDAIQAPVKIDNVTIPMRLISYEPSTLIKVQGREAIYTRYCRQGGSKPPVTVHCYHFSHRHRYVIISLSYRDCEEALWKVDLFKSFASLTFAEL